MTAKTSNKGRLAPKKVYKTPRLKSLGNVKTLTLKTGSSVDGFGTFG
ncbi:hypothetical protein SAMN06269250_4425 [Spirosoma fluviale]|uniref:Lasso RiPP family leader peptide-containing protein n=1 Tax=Spirosoma fluviale TaxID=1597977 RepID=A0A286GCI9_9BACT|nr:hypothetical protein SAMN06269250_4425 [Spirosoma fluviale]